MIGWAFFLFLGDHDPLEVWLHLSGHLTRLLLHPAASRHSAWRPIAVATWLAAHIAMASLVVPYAAVWVCGIALAGILVAIAYPVNKAWRMTAPLQRDLAP